MAKKEIKTSAEKAKEFIIVNIDPDLSENGRADAYEQAERKLYDVFSKYSRGTACSRQTET